LRRRVKPGEELTRTRIGAAALEVLADGGLDELTLRKVAARLGVQHGALYWHVKDKQDLLDEAAQALLRREFERVDPPIDANWRDWLEAIAHRLRAAMLSHRDGAAIVVTSRSKARVDVLAELGNAMVGGLGSLGFPPGAAFATQLALLGYVLGFTAQEQATVERRLPLEISERFAALNEAKNAKSAEDGATALFADGLGLLLDGAAIRQRPSPQP
jgi:TetR/AcrR family tetracycline transcriptional repressor